LKLSKKAMEWWKNLLHPPSIYKERGVASRNCLDMTVASYQGDACPLRRS
jgi:hypothetical protein